MHNRGVFHCIIGESGSYCILSGSFSLYTTQATCIIGRVDPISEAYWFWAGCLLIGVWIWIFGVATRYIFGRLNMDKESWTRKVFYMERDKTINAIGSTYTLIWIPLMAYTISAVQSFKQPDHVNHSSWVKSPDVIFGEGDHLVLMWWDFFFCSSAVEFLECCYAAHWCSI